jgi:transposase
MTLYNNFIGIDIGKFNFVTAIYGNKQTKEYRADSEGIANFIKDHQHLFAKALCVLETTGGYEMELLLTLCSQTIAVHRANSRKVKNFIRSFGNGAKTDALDAKALALYGFERAARLELFQPQSIKALRLYELIQRRFDLKQILIAEKNRLQSPKINFTKSSCQSVIEVISTELETIITLINSLIEEDEVLQAKKEVLKTVPAIGNIIANELLVLLPELGSIDRRKIASLAGLAPRSNDSGLLKGYRRTAHGRNCIKPILFLSAMAARNSNSELKQFYEKMINRGKKKMVALTALMRKIIVIANAKLRDFNAGCVAIKI